MKFILNINNEHAQDDSCPGATFCSIHIEHIVKVCSINFEPPAESPWTNAVPAQLWLFLVKITSSWHDLINNACQNRPESKRQCFNRAICYFKIASIKQEEATTICLRHVASVNIESSFALKKENLSLPLN